MQHVVLAKTCESQFSEAKVSGMHKPLEEQLGPDGFSLVECRRRQGDAARTAAHITTSGKGDWAWLSEVWARRIERCELWIAQQQPVS
ncbi:hypothetical protein A4V12_00690 [Streptomyces noursei]|nr:hypothetical protein A4V12_00690 [Streptomyces noursei]